MKGIEELTLGATPGPITDVKGAYDRSLLPEEIIDQALRRLYEGLIRAGYFDPAGDSPYRSLDCENINTAEAQDLALQSVGAMYATGTSPGIKPRDGRSYQGT